MKERYDIFISYRRDGGGFEMANLLHDRLTQSGYKVFMDVENIRSGKFNTQIYQQIDNCKDFILVLGANSLDRCVNEDDWVRLEISHAIKSDKNIIPIFLRNFKYPEELLPVDIMEIKNYEGIESSQELFSAFLNQLKGMLLSKRHMTWSRIRKQMLFIVLPILFLAGTLLFIHYYNKQNEQAHLEQVCKQVVSEMAVGLGNGNLLLSTIEETNNEWQKFYDEYSSSKDALYKQQLKNDLIQFVDFKLKQISDTSKVIDIKLTPAHEELLAKNSISIEDIKASKMMFISNINETKDFLLKIKYWLSVPDMAWPLQIDESIDILASMNKEMINADIFSFNELILEMPISVRDVYTKFSPNLTKYSYIIDYSKNRNELESEQEKSIKKCEELMNKYSIIIGDENKIVSWMSNQLDSLKNNKKKVYPIKMNSFRVDSMEKVVAEKYEILQQNKAELEAKIKLIRDSYQRKLTKCSFDKNEAPSMMWGKIINLAQFGYSQIKFENKIMAAENESLKQDPKLSQTRGVNLTPAVSSIEVFTEVQKLLDIYLEYNKAKDPNASLYIPAVKQYYKLVSERKVEPIGILIIESNDATHSLLKVGDIVCERKGHVVDRIETYEKLKEDPNPNVLKLIRFVSGKKAMLTKTIPPDCKILFGTMNLWE